MQLFAHAKITTKVETLQSRSTYIQLQRRRPQYMPKPNLLHINDENNDKRRKHINIKYHYVQEQRKEKQLSPIWIETGNNIADIFTKPLTSPKFDPFSNKILGVTP